MGTSEERRKLVHFLRMLKPLVRTTHLLKYHTPSQACPKKTDHLTIINIGVCMYDVHVYDCVFESVYLGSSVFLVPFLNFASKFIVKSLARVATNVYP